MVEDLKILIVGTCRRQVLKRGSGEDDVSTRGLDATGTSNRDLYDSYRCLYDTCSAYSTIDDCMKYMTDT